VRIGQSNLAASGGLGNNHLKLHFFSNAREDLLLQTLATFLELDFELTGIFLKS
jgi:hypothetical protein